jgi:hypothetical protein
VVVPAALADVERSTAVFDQRLTGRLEEFAEAEHERWMRERIGRGWSYGPERDDGAKRHPCLLAYDQLSDEDKDKDRVAVIALPEMLAKAGFAVEPVAGE